MAQDIPPLLDDERPLQLTREDHDALVAELEALRARHRAELERGLRDAREHGSRGENDDMLAVFEEAAIDKARIAQLEELVRRATVVDDDVPFDGRAGLGSTVRVIDDRGRTREYELVGRRREDAEARHVTLASPVGRALAGARAGDVVRVVLPSGADRTLEVLDVSRVGPAAAAA